MSGHQSVHCPGRITLTQRLLWEPKRCHMDKLTAETTSYISHFSLKSKVTLWAPREQRSVTQNAILDDRQYELQKV